MCACHHYPLFQILIKTVKLPDWCSPGVISDSLYLNQSHRNYFNSESKWTYTSTLIFIYVQTFNNVLFYKYSSRHKAKLLLLYVSVPICMCLYVCYYIYVPICQCPCLCLYLYLCFFFKKSTVYHWIT